MVVVALVEVLVVVVAAAEVVMCEPRGIPAYGGKIREPAVRTGIVQPMLRNSRKACVALLLVVRS